MVFKKTDISAKTQKQHQPQTNNHKYSVQQFGGNTFISVFSVNVPT